MSFSTYSVPWWGWLLCALPLWFASWVCSTLCEEAKYSGRSSKWESAWERTLAAKLAFGRKRRVLHVGRKGLHCTSMVPYSSKQSLMPDG